MPETFANQFVNRAWKILGAGSANVSRFDIGHEPNEGGELILATSKVEDFDRWMKIFSTRSVERRKQGGSKGSTVFRDPNENSRVWVLFDWDEEDWKNFVSDPDFPAMLQEAGLASRPQMAELAGQYDA